MNKLIESSAMACQLRIVVSLLAKIQPRLRHLGLSLQDQLLLNFTKDLEVLQHLLVDAYDLLLMEIYPNKPFYESRKHYLNQYAPELLDNSVNPSWLYKIMKMVETELLNLDIPDERLLEEWFNPMSTIRLIKQQFGSIVTFDRSDAFNFDYEHPVWKPLWAFTRRVKLGDPKEIRDSIESFYEKIETVTAVSQSSATCNNPFARFGMEAVGGVTYFFSKSRRNRTNLSFKTHIDARLGRSVWNRGQVGIAKTFMGLILPYVNYVRKIYLRDAYPMVTEKTIIDWVKGKTTQPTLKDKLSIPYTYDELFAQDENRFRVRVMCPQNFERKSSDDANFQSCILHAHGGGFVALSSRSHQSYTRRWCKQCYTPVFSVDYRKAPEFPYPCALDDLWQTYNFIVKQSHNFFKLKKNKKILVVGDSAGANLIIGVVNLSILNNLPLPVHMTLYYPCVTLDIKNFTPSYIHVINNPMIPYEFLLFCAEAYIQRKEFRNKRDFLIQPLYTPEEMFKKFPPTHIYQGQRDPLHDHCVKFALRLREAGVNVDLTLYEEMVHGFLSLDIFMVGVKQARKCVQESVQLMKKLLT